jgi:hypothetical protein
MVPSKTALAGTMCAASASAGDDGRLVLSAVAAGFAPGVVASAVNGIGKRHTAAAIGKIRKAVIFKGRLLGTAAEISSCRLLADVAESLDALCPDGCHGEGPSCRERYLTLGGGVSREEGAHAADMAPMANAQTVRCHVVHGDEELSTRRCGRRPTNPAVRAKYH